MSKNDALRTTNTKGHNRANTNGIENNMSEITEELGNLDTAIRVIKIEKFQRYCLKCGKILPLDIKQNFYHECERPDFVKDKLGI